MAVRRPADLPRVVVALAAVLAVGVLVSVVAVLPGVRAEPGFNPIVDGWIKVATYLTVASLVTLRAVLRSEDRRAWSWLAAGYVFHALGFAAWLGWARWQDPVPYPSIADAAWLLSAPAFLAGLVLLLRDRWPRRSRAVLLDALAAAAVAASITVGALSGAVNWGGAIDGPGAAVALAYPLLDVTVITGVAALVAGLGWRWRSASVTWLAVSIVGMYAVDVIFAIQTAAGTFRPASLLSGLSVAATAAGAVAAWVPARDAPAMDRTALPGLRVPAFIGLGATGMLLAGAWGGLAVAAPLLAGIGLLLLAGRVALTFRVANEVERLRRAQQVARLGSWASDAGRVNEEWAAANVALMGPDPNAAAVHDITLSDVVVEEDLGPVLAALRAGEQTGWIDVTYRVTSKDNEVRTVRARAEADLDERGRPARWVGTLQDVTEQHVLAAALAESEAMLRRVLTATNDGWWTLDLRTADALISDRWWDLHGYEPPELPVTGPPWELVADPDSAAQVEVAVQQAMAELLPSTSVTFVSRHLDGHHLPLLLRMLLEYDDTGEPIRLSAAATDLTSARQAEAAKDALVAAVSHELRTPLTPIVGFSELLRRSDSLTAEQLQAVHAIERNATHLAALVDGLLTVSAAEQERDAPRPGLLNVTGHIRVLLDDRRDAEANLVAPRAPQPTWVDPTHLTQILGNLLDNAARHGEPPIEVHVQQEGTDTVVTVSDHGPGIPDWFIPELFDDFSQATSGDQRPTLGLGLGLAIARRLAQANGGALDHVPTSHRTTFVLRLPTRAPEPDPAHRLPGANSAPSHGTRRVPAERSLRR